MSIVKIEKDLAAPDEGPVAVPESRRPKLGSQAKDSVFSGFSHAFLLAWGAMVVFPLLWVVLSAFKDDSQILKDPLSLIPNALHWNNFSRAWGAGHIGAFFLNSVIIVGGGVFLTMLLGSMAAYVLARYDFPGNRLIYYMFLSRLTLPVYLAAVPLYKGVFNTGKAIQFLGPNQHSMLIVVYVALSLFFRVMLPMSKPGLISIGIFNVLGQWNQWYLPYLLMQPTGDEPKHQVLAQGLIDLSVNQGYKSDWSGLFAGVTMAMLPVLIVYIIFQRQVQSGLTAGVGK